MTAPAKPIRLVHNLMPGGIHESAWKVAERPGELPTDIVRIVENARLAEAGLIDGIFMPDSPGGLSLDPAPRQPWRGLDPIVTFTAIAAATEHIGLIPTFSALFGSPFDLARRIGSLDQVSNGRAGWNVITSQNPTALDAFGVDSVYDTHEKYVRATEFVTIAHELWSSLPAEALVADAATHRYVNPDLTRPVDVAGSHYRSRGVLPIPAYGDNKPVIVQAGFSDQSRTFGARWADALFTTHRTIESGRQFTSHVRDLAERAGRSRDDLLVLPGILLYVAASDAEAEAIKRDLDERADLDFLRAALAERLGIPAELLDPAGPVPFDAIEAQLHTAEGDYLRHDRINLLTEARERDLDTRGLLLNHFTAGHRVVLGTPERVADDLEAWVDEGASDGFAFQVPTSPAGITSVTDGLIPELQRRGRFRTEYTGGTFRDNLGVGPGARVGELTLR